MNLGGILGTIQDWFTGAKSNVNTVKETSKAVTHAKANPAPYKKTPLAQPSPGLRKLLTDNNWTVPDVQKQVGMPKKSFDLGQAQELKSHTYSLEAPEWKRAQEYYNSQNAQAWGWVAPAPEEDPIEVAKQEELDAARRGSLAPPGSTLTPEQEMDAARVRADLLKGGGSPKITEENYSAAPLTWDAYNALSAEQRTAIDWNTLLVAAREKDLARAPRPPKYLESPENAQAQAEYDEKVKNIFGEAGGSDVRAESTITLLDNLGIRAQGQDLDEYLGLNRAITSTEMADIEFTPDQVKQIENLVSGETLDDTQMTKFSEVRSPENLKILDATTIEAAGTKIKELMLDPELGLWNFESAVPGLIGEQRDWSSVDVPMGFGTPELRGGGTDNVVNYMETWLGEAYNHLKSTQGDPKDVWDDMVDKQFTAEDTKTFFEYMDTMLRKEEEFGEPPAVEGAGKTRTAKEIRRILGMES